MPEITKERLGEIALIAFLAQKREEGITLRPKEIKRNLLNETRKHGISSTEGAMFAKFIVEEIYRETMKEIDSVIEKGE